VNITKENIDSLNAVVKIQLAPEDYVTKVEDAVKNLRKKVELKGFRKGQTPASLVKKMYGNSVLADELNKIINDQLNNFLTENKIEVLGNPIPKEDVLVDIDINTPKNYEFAYELGLTPEFELNLLSKNSTFILNKIKVDDELLNKEIEGLRKRFGKMTNPEDAVQKDDVLFGEFTELNADGTEKVNAYTHSTAFPVDMITDEAVQQQLLALTLNGTVQLDIYKAVGNKTKEEVAKHFLNLTGDDVDAKSSLYRFTLKKINRVNLAELDEEFFNIAVGPGKAKTEEEFREVLRNEISKYFETQTKRILHNNILDELLSKTEIPLPDDFLKRWIKVSNEKPISAEEIEAQYPDFAKSLKWRLITNKLIKEHNITVTQDEVKERTKKGLQGYLNVDDELMESEEYQSWINNMLSNKDHVQKTFDQLLEEKLFAVIETQVSVVEKEISLDDFKNLK
jgi:trigger factor